MSTPPGRCLYRQAGLLVSGWPPARGTHGLLAHSYLARYDFHRSLLLMAALRVNGIDAGNHWVATTDFFDVIPLA
jgi:hypothetical protein